MENENHYLSERQVEAITGRIVFSLRNDLAKHSRRKTGVSKDGSAKKDPFQEEK